MHQQSTATVIMVRPDHFGYNPQTSKTNPFMHTPLSLHKNMQQIRDAAVKEFETMVASLQALGITVLVLPSRDDVMTPDAVFPNNWMSHHADGQLVLYPMLTSNRRMERQQELLQQILKQNGIGVSTLIDLTSDEEKGLILESTGSMVLDRVHKVAFAMASPRTTREEFEKWCRLMEYEGVYIVTPQYHRKEVYHTNLLMCIGTSFVVVCLEVIEDAQMQSATKKRLASLGKEIIEISINQVYAFCGNILEVQSMNGQKKIIMSTTAYKAFTEEQIAQLEQYGDIVKISIPIIEKVGGGGVRCMMAEVFPTR